jgi:hypothetical protein
MHSVNDRGIVFIRLEADGSRTIAVGSAFAEGVPQGVFACLRGVGDVEISPEVSFTESGGYEISDTVVELQTTWASQRLVSIVPIPDSSLLAV